MFNHLNCRQNPDLYVKVSLLQPPFLHLLHHQVQYHLNNCLVFTFCHLSTHLFKHILHHTGTKTELHLVPFMSTLLQYKLTHFTLWTSLTFKYSASIRGQCQNFWSYRGMASDHLLPTILTVPLTATYHYNFQPRFQTLCNFYSFKPTFVSNSPSHNRILGVRGWTDRKRHRRNEA